jgi:hypothetical protein
MWIKDCSLFLISLTWKERLKVDPMKYRKGYYVGLAEAELVNKCNIKVEFDSRKESRFLTVISF